MNYTIKYYADPFVPFYRAHIGLASSLIEEREKIFTNKDKAIAFWEECCNPISEYPNEETFDILPKNIEEGLDTLVSSNYNWEETLTGKRRDPLIQAIEHRENYLKEKLKRIKQLNS